MNSILILLGFFSCGTFACQPIWRMYESRGYGEDYVENGAELVSITDVWDIAEHGLEHFRMYTCPQGVWVGFRYPGFSGGSNLEYNYNKMGGVLQCSYQNTGRYFQSLKLVGHPNDYTASALTTFQGVTNELAATTYLNNTEQIFNRNFNSFTLMGSQEMEIFTGANFTGTSYCVGPNNGHIFSRDAYDQVNHLRNGTQLFTNLYYVEDVFGTTDFNSFRFGCEIESRN